MLAGLTAPSRNPRTRFSLIANTKSPRIGQAAHFLTGALASLYASMRIAPQKGPKILALRAHRGRAPFR